MYSISVSIPADAGGLSAGVGLGAGELVGIGMPSAWTVQPIYRFRLRSMKSRGFERDPAFQRIIDEARASGRATLLQWQRANGGSATRC